MCGGIPRDTNFIKSDSARRDGCTSPPSPKKRQKLIISGRQRNGSMWGRDPSSTCTSSASLTCSFTICTSNTVGAYVLAEGTEIVDDALHLHRTLAHTRWRYRFRLHGSES